MPSHPHPNVATAIKTEEDAVDGAETAGDGVFHRKSKRRRVARDIFLVFEEQPSSRRSRGRGAATKKSKFGHLKVEDPTKKGLLRDIKNEPKCYLNHNNNNSNSNSSSSNNNNNKNKNSSCPKRTITKPKATATEETVTAAPIAIAPNVNATTVSVESCAKAENALPNEYNKTARVNPIFLWVKQEDTRIVEVRCEDYDKRNRIRITKTTNGWQAIPRTDPTSSRIVKFFQTPMLKVKREFYANQMSALDDLANVSQMTNHMHADAEWESGESFGDVDVARQSQEQEISNEPATVNNEPIVEMENEEEKPQNQNKIIRLKSALLKRKCLNKKRRKKYKTTKRKKKQPQIESSLDDDIEREALAATDSTANKYEMLENITDETTIVSDSGLGSQEPIIEKDSFQKCVDIDADMTTMTAPTNTPIVKSDTYQLNNCGADENDEDHDVGDGDGGVDGVDVGECIDGDDDGDDTVNVQSANQNESQSRTPELQLCPKTGLFLRNIIAEDDPKNESAINLENKEDGILMEFVDSSTQLVEYGKVRQLLDTENLDVETKNLKDLLDDADDLLQHCSDNANSDAELIDSLVKRSCENNLIQETSAKDEVNNISNLQSFTTAVAASVSASITADSVDGDALLMTPKSVNDSTALIPPEIADTVSEPPKCLSFNEAGEIEGINGELYQSSNISDSFDKESIIIESIQIHNKDDTASINSGIESVTNISATKTGTTTTEDDDEEDKVVEIFDDTPRDLSYKKREEVCPPPESRSQCAVTSSSDVVKSPISEKIPPVIESTSDTIKNLILEQFIKMNALTTSGIVSSPVRQQTEPIDLGTQKQQHHAGMTSNHKYVSNANFIETVVIDDNSDEEPVKKRVRNNAVPHSSQHETTTPITASIVIDKDPDPLTQLQLLIKNTQWKVPDPILVPKDRLGAVLASPAREIPLLITTRPELRLPEAFAYPEIIQNPNILVISMAQLEAILKNEMDIEKSKSHTKQTPMAISNDFRSTLSNQNRNSMQTHSSNEPHHRVEPKTTLNLHTSEPIQVTIPQPQPHQRPQLQLQTQTHLTPPAKEPKTKCTPADSNLASDINTATLAVLNQLLWLPYFGQLSQEFFKTLKEPINNVQKNVLPLYNQAPQFGLQNLDDLYKYYNKQLTTLRSLSAEPADAPPTPCYTPNPITPLQNPLELAIFQKLVEHQMNNLLRLNTFTPATPEPAVDKHAGNGNSFTTPPLLGHTFETKKSGSKPLMKPINATTTPYEGLLELPQKMHCNNVTDNAFLNKYMAAGNSFEKQTHERESKPRLTCKSLSNLLQPETQNTAAASAHSLNFAANGMRGKIEAELKTLDSKALANESLGSVEPTLRSLRSERSKCAAAAAAAAAVAADITKQQRKRCLNFMEQATATAANNINNSSGLNSNAIAPATDGLSVDANVLWHPLFGSNTKAGYSSPWQWTTVTATGE